VRADKIIKNARIFTADAACPQATALVVKDGKFVYVGDEAGLAGYEGEYVFYYNNIKDNVAKRIATYKASRQ